MPARSIATLTVSFGMVSIPVKLFSATEASRAISFNLLHKTCGSRLKQQYICVKEEVPVAREDMAKGYEFEKDQYVMFSPEELKALEEAGTHTADIAEFVPVESIDPVYFDKAYYLAPDKGGAKPYALLARALRESGRCALGRWAARGKQYIVMIRPVEDGRSGGAQSAQARPAARAHRSESREEINRTADPPAMHQYGVRDVERLLRLPRSTIRSLVNAGFVSPERGPRKSYLFSFQDLIVLRTAQALAAAKVPPRRITKSLKQLRRHLPDAMPLSRSEERRVGKECRAWWS